MGREIPDHFWVHLLLIVIVPQTNPFSFTVPTISVPPFDALSSESIDAGPLSIARLLEPAMDSS